jgi:hypothetical protein
LQDMQDLAFLSGVQEIRNDRWEHTQLDWNAQIPNAMAFGFLESWSSLS